VFAVIILFLLLSVLARAMYFLFCAYLTCNKEQLVFDSKHVHTSVPLPNDCLLIQVASMHVK
jgi:hypothetical protein